jgi:hypothetical protein
MGFISGSLQLDFLALSSLLYFAYGVHFAALPTKEASISMLVYL